MTEIHKWVCDYCGKEKDFITPKVGDRAEWQTVWVDRFPYALSGEQHACCKQCATAILELENKK